MRGSGREPEEEEERATDVISLEIARREKERPGEREREEEITR